MILTVPLWGGGGSLALMPGVAEVTALEAAFEFGTVLDVDMNIALGSAIRHHQGRQGI
jgi:hypothetical protein